MTIKHLVIPGGGPMGIKALGALQTLAQNNLWSVEDIQSIYATSAGAIIAVLICMKLKWEIINDYIIHKPWADSFNISLSQVYNVFTKKGLFEKDHISKSFFKPFFIANKISLDITLLEFYQLSNIEFHVFATEINQFILTDISYKTHPDLSLITAVQMTTAIPLLFEPVFLDDNKCFIDGGLMCNYPIHQCICAAESPDDILGIINNYTQYDETSVNKETNVLDYLFGILGKIIDTIRTPYEINIKEKIKHEIIYDATYMSISNIRAAISSKDEREQMLMDGQAAGMEYLDNLYKKSAQESEKEFDKESEKESEKE